MAGVHSAYHVHDLREFALRKPSGLTKDLAKAREARRIRDSRRQAVVPLVPPSGWHFYPCTHHQVGVHLYTAGGCISSKV